MVNQEEDIIACICLRAYPNISALPPSEWTDWTNEHYEISDLNSENTLFIHLLVWDPRYNWKFLGYLLKTIFLNQANLFYIVLVSPPNHQSSILKINFLFLSKIYEPLYNNFLAIRKMEHLLDKYFTRILPIYQNDFDKSQSLFISFRDTNLIPMKIRRAV